MKHKSFNFLIISFSLLMGASNLSAQERYVSEDCQSEADTISKNFKKNIEYYTKEVYEHADEINDKLKDIAEYVSEKPEISKIALAFKNYKEKEPKNNQVKVTNSNEVSSLLYSSLSDMLPELEDYYEKECAKGINWRGGGHSSNSLFDLFHDKNKHCAGYSPYLTGRARLTTNKKRESRIEFCREVREPNTQRWAYFTVCGYLNLVTGEITLGRNNALRRISLGSPDSDVYMNLTNAVEDYTSRYMSYKHQECKSVSDTARNDRTKDASQKASAKPSGSSSAAQQ